MRRPSGSRLARRVGEDAPVTELVRRLWQVAEPFHALTYFAPEAHSAYEDVGLRGFWRGYFAGRSAPLGSVGAGPVVALFHGFHPDFVARALPSIWSLASPAQALQARLDGIAAAVRRLFPEPEWDETFAEAAELLRPGLESCAVAGRPLFAANRDLEWPSAPALALWHATTLAREHRGDGHVVALVHAGLDACEAHVTRVAAAGVPLDSISPYRGWESTDWEAAADRLRQRALLDDTGHLTADGTALRERVERDTDRFASEAIASLPAGDVDRAVALLSSVATRLADDGVIPYPNPIGVPDPRRAA